MKLITECAANSGWQEVKIQSASEKDKLYTVVLPPWERVQEEIICDCPSYEFRGYCRHQSEALQRICHWSEVEGRLQTEEHVCPECGGPTQTVWYPYSNE